MTNPWKQTLLAGLRDVLRFALWLCVVFNGLMFAVFLTLVCYQLLTHAWDWLLRNVFTGSW